MLYWYRERELIGDGDNDGGGGDDSDDAYKGSTEPMLVLLSESYSEDNRFLSR